MIIAFIICIGLLFSLSESFSIQSGPSARSILTRNKLFMTHPNRLPLIAGNWKMNTDLQTAVQLAKELADVTKDVDPSKVEMAVIPPFPFLTEVGKITSATPQKIKLGAQNTYFENKGAYTGAVSAVQLKSCGCQYCLVGHSERRKVFGESDVEFNLIVKKVHEVGMIPILCIGETKEEYELGLNEQICTCQLARDLNGVPPELVAKTVIAYEPVWAIGTGLTASPEIAQSVHAAIRGWLRKKYGNDIAEQVRIQYGGSVTAENVDALMSMPDIDGALVGGASLTASSFARIANFK